MKRVGIGVLLLSVLFLTACPAIEQNARDTAAALNGAIVSAQAQYNSQCKGEPGAKECVIINQAADAQNALITATEAYCGWSTTAPPPDPATTKCVPVRSAQAGLRTAIANANLLITELKGIVKK